jgi:cytochrome P450
MPTHHVNRHADVRAVLADPRFTVTPPGTGGRPGTLAWLRATAPRFSEGPAHRRRRALTLSQLDRLDPADLRREAAKRTRTGLGADVMALARAVPAAVLGHGLGVADDDDALVPAVAVAAADYLVPQGEPGAADPAVALLAEHVPAAGDLVVLDIAAANRDPSVFTGPDHFDPDRAAIPHLTFGAGRHRCPGAAHALALAEGMAEVLLS